MSRKPKEVLEVSLIQTEEGTWNIISPGGTGLVATYFEICIWKEVLRQRKQIAYLQRINNMMRQMIDTANQARLT